MKTKEEINALKEEIKDLNKKLAELTEEELTQVSGGALEPPVGPVLDTSVLDTSVLEPPVPTPNQPYYPEPNVIR